MMGLIPKKKTKEEWQLAWLDKAALAVTVMVAGVAIYQLIAFAASFVIPIHHEVFTLFLIPIGWLLMLGGILVYWQLRDWWEDDRYERCSRPLLEEIRKTAEQRVRWHETMIHARHSWEWIRDTVKSQEPGDDSK